MERLHLLRQRIINLLSRMFCHNPYYSSAALMARVSTNMATLIWAIVVLFLEPALNPSRFPYYSHMTKIMDEDIWAGGAIVFALFGTVRLFTRSRPRWFGSVGYAAQMLFWCYICIALFLDLPFPLPPATTAALITVAGLSIYAFVSNAHPPKHESE